MNARYALPALIAIPVALCLTAAPVQKPQRVSFMREGVVKHKGVSAIVIANDPRPLAQATSAVREEYGWIVDYEDPPYVSDSELADDTSPIWRVGHPNQRGVRRVAGGAFQSEYQEGSAVANSEGEEAILRKIVSEYNQSGNPGKFIVRAEGEGRFAIIGSSVKNKDGKDEDVTPILDTAISIPAVQRSADATIELILRELSGKGGRKVVLATAPANLLMQSQVSVGGENLPARTLLLQTLNATKRPVHWRLLYNADRPMYFLNLAIATRNLYDTYGRKVSMPIDYSTRSRSN